MDAAGGGLALQRGRGAPCSRELMRQGHFSNAVSSTREELHNQLRHWLDAALPERTRSRT